MNSRRSGKTMAAAVIAVVLVVVGSCDNFMSGGDDFKKKIKQEVREANAPTYTITVRAQDDAMGTTSPLGSTNVKKGIPFRITTTVNSAYGFISWVQEGGQEGDIVFEDARSVETTATVRRNSEGLGIRATFSSRPAIRTVTPVEGDRVVKNQPIIVNFTKAMDPASFREPGMIRVSYDLINAENPNPITIYESGIDSDFFTTTISDTRLSLIPRADAPTNGNYMPSNRTIEVFVSATLRDTDGNTMPAGREWYFTTSNVAEAEPPFRDPPVEEPNIRVLNGHGASATPAMTYDPGDGGVCYVISTSNITLDNLAYSILGGAGSTVFVQNITIEEPGHAPLVDGYSDNYPYTIKNFAEGRIELVLYTTSSTGTESERENICLYYDVTAPSVGAVSVNPTAGSNVKTGDTVSISFTVGDGAGTGVDPDSIGVAFSSGGAAVAGPVSVTLDGATVSASYAVTAADTDGGISYTINVRDFAGNAATPVTAATGVLVDTTPPVIQNVQVTPASGTFVKSGDTVSLSFDVVETGSGINSTTVMVGFTSGGAAVGNSQPVNIDGNTVTTGFTIGNGDTEGEIAYTISLADNAGNTASAGPTNTNIHYDNTPPTVVISTDSDKVAGKQGDAVRFIATFTDANPMREDPPPSITIRDGGTDVVAAVPMTMTGNKVWYYDWTVPTGDYLAAVTVEAADAAGNPVEEPVDPTTFVVDNTPPGIGAVTPTPASGFVKSGDTVSISFTVADGAGSGVDEDSIVVSFSSGGIAIPAGRVSVGVLGSTVTASYAVTAADTDGGISYTIDISDLAGNEAVPVTAATGVTVDTTPPEIGVVTVTAPVGDFVKDGETVSISFTVADGAGSGVDEDSIVVSFSSGGTVIPAGRVTVSVDGSTVTANYLTSAADTEGAVAYTISVADDIGNPSELTGGTGVTFDKTPPSVAIGTDLSVWFNSTTVEISGTASDAGSGVASVEYSLNGEGGPWTSLNWSAGNWSRSVVFVEGDGNELHVRATDNANNTTTLEAVTVKIDTTPPVIGAVTPNPASGFVKAGDTVSISFTVEDGAGSGVDEDSIVVSFSSGGTAIPAGRVTVSVDGSTVTASYAVTAADTDGGISYTIDISDLAGNEAVPVTAATGVTVDTTPPEIGVVTVTAPVGDFVKDGETVSISFTVEDGAGSGVDANSIVVSFSSGGTAISADRVTVSVVGSTVTASYLTSSADTEGAVAYTISVADDIGNPSELTGGTGVTFDKTPPSVAIGTDLSVWFNSTTVEISGTASDAGSGVASVEYSLNGEGGPWTSLNWSAGNWSRSVVFVEGDGNELLVRATDNANNTTTLEAVTVKIDTTPPDIGAVEVTPASGFVKSGDTVSISFTVEDGAGSGVDEDSIVVSFSSGGTAIPADRVSVGVLGSTVTAIYVTDTSDTEGAVAYTIAAADNLGNESELPGGTGVIFDKTPPTVAIGTDLSVWFNSTSVLISGTASDAGSGVDSVEYRVDAGDWESVGALDGDGSWSPSIAFAEGSNQLIIRATDVAGNTTTLDAVTVQVDVTYPTFGALEDRRFVNNDDDPPSGTLTVTMEPDASGFSAILYSDKRVTDGSADWPDSPNTATGFVVEDEVELQATIGFALMNEGDFFLYRVVDGAGNQSETKSVTRGADASFTLTSIAAPGGSGAADEAGGGGVVGWFRDTFTGGGGGSATRSGGNAQDAGVPAATGTNANTAANNRSAVARASARRGGLPTQPERAPGAGVDASQASPVPPAPQESSLGPLGVAIASDSAPDAADHRHPSRSTNSDAATQHQSDTAGDVALASRIPPPGQRGGASAGAGGAGGASGTELGLLDDGDGLIPGSYDLRRQLVLMGFLTAVGLVALFYGLAFRLFQRKDPDDW